MFFECEAGKGEKGDKGKKENFAQNVCHQWYATRLPGSQRSFLNKICNWLWFLKNNSKAHNVSAIAETTVMFSQMTDHQFTIQRLSELS